MTANPKWPFDSPTEFGNAEHIAHIRNIEGRTIDGETYIEIDFEFFDKKTEGNVGQTIANPKKNE